MISGNFIKVSMSDLEEKIRYNCDWYNVYISTSLGNKIYIKYTDEEENEHEHELSKYDALLKRIVSDFYNFYFNDYIAIENYVYFFEEDIEIKRRK